MNLLTRLRRGEPEISRLSFNDVIQLIAQKTSPFGVMNGPVTYTGRRPAERVENSFRGYINGAYKVNPIVFGIMTKRASVLSEARFAWREKVAGKPGDIYYDDALSVLENPWPNGTTGELIARMIQDVDLAGNCYIVNEGDRLRRLRPDWVEIILSGDPLKDLDVDVLGYKYTAGGPDSGGESKAYLPADMCHWSPSPDPDALYRGMSWVTPVIREIMADQVAVTHKLKFFENGAVLGPIITAPPGLTISQFQEFVDAAESAHRGAENAYKTLYLAGGTDVTLASANMQQMDFSGLQGKTETRLCVAANMPASIAGVSEGLQGSSLNAGNYGAAKREWADTWLRPTWRSACAALSTIVDAPDDADLWYDECDVTFLHEDQQDAATIAQLQMSTIVSAITGGFEPDAAVITVNSAWKDTLKHSGLVSVQLTPPGQGEVPPGAPVGPTGGPTDLPPVPPGFEPDATVRALLAAADMLRATQSQNTGNTGGSGGKTLHEPSGSPKGGQFTANPGGGGGGGGGYKSILPPDSGYKSGGGGSKKSAAPSAPQGTPQPPAAPRTMKVGDSGEDVRYAQYGLSLLGFNVKQDGVYGPETEAAVKEMQARLGVKKPNGHLSASQLRQIQTAVRLSPCIGRSEVDAAQDMFDEIMRAFEDDVEDEEPDDEGDIADEDEVDQDEGDAELVDAVLEALDLVESGEIEVARAHDVSGELRIPGGVGGGRWTKSPVSAAILKALKEAKGPDSFTLDGKPIDREPLRKAAVARGIKLPRGASRDDIVKALLDDVGGKSADKSEAKPSAPSPRADAGRDISSSVDFAALPPTTNLADYSDSAMQEIQHRQGFDGPPATMSQADFDAAVKAGTIRQTYRGVENAAAAESYRTGPLRASAISINGSGTYSALRPEDAKLYGPEVLPVGIRSDARVISITDLDAEMDKYFAAHPGNARIQELDRKLAADLSTASTPQRRADLRKLHREEVMIAGPDISTKIQRDPGRFAALRGYDAIEIPKANSPDRHHEFVILNRTATVVPSAAGSTPSPRADAKAKYAKVAQSRPYASAAAAIAELTGKKQSNAVIAEHVRAIAHPDSPDMAEAAGTAAHDLEQVAAAFAAGNPALGKRRMTAALKKQGITQGPAGTVPFDPAAHEHLGDVPAPGTPVSVVRPGMSLHRGEGDHVQLSKAVVMSAPGKAPAKAAKAAPSNPAEILASLPADLTPAQQRARLRSRGVSKAEIDALVPLKSAKAPRTPLGPGGADDLAEEFYRHPKYTEQQIHDRLAGLNLAELKKVATATNVGLPRDLIKTEAGPVFQPLKKISADDLRRYIAAKIAGDRKLLANEDKFGARSENLDAEDLIRSEDDEDDEDDEDYDDEPSPLELAAMAGEDPDAVVERAVGADVTPGHDELHHYWTRGEGLAKWAESPKPWTTLVAHLTKYVGPEKAKIYASRWFIEVFGFAAGSDLNRVTHGKPPRGHRVGPG